MIGIINSTMFGAPLEPTEHVDWSSPDWNTREDWEGLLGQSVEDYAASWPHMIVFEHERERCPECHCTLRPGHEPGSRECQEDRRERERSRRR